MPRPRRKSHLAHRRSAAAESTRRHCRFCGESACTVAVAVAASSSGAAAGEEGVQTTPTLGVFPTKCCRPPPRPISHFLSASVFLKRQKQGPGRGEAGPRSRTGSRPAWASLIPERHIGYCLPAPSSEDCSPPGTHPSPLARPPSMVSGPGAGSDAWLSRMMLLATAASFPVATPNAPLTSTAPSKAGADRGQQQRF